MMDNDKKQETKANATSLSMAGGFDSASCDQQKVNDMLLIPDPLSPNTLERCRSKPGRKGRANRQEPQRVLRRSTRARRTQQQHLLELVEDTGEDKDEVTESNETELKSAKESEEEAADNTSQLAVLQKEKRDHDGRNSLSAIEIDDIDVTFGHQSADDGAKFKLEKKLAPVEEMAQETFIIPAPTLLERQSTMDHLMQDAMPLTLSPGVTDWYQQGISLTKGNLMDDLERDRARLIMEKCRALVGQWPPLATQINEASVRTKDGRIIAPPLLPPPNHNSTAIEPNVCNSNEEASTNTSTRCQPTRRCRTKLDRMLAPAAYPQQVQKLRRVSKLQWEEAMEFINLPSTPLQSLAAHKPDDGPTPKTSN